MARPATGTELGAAERQGLEALVRPRSTPQQIALRARIVLPAADGRTNIEISRQVDVSRETARLWRERWVGLQGTLAEQFGVAERLTDAPRSGAPARISAEQVCPIVALACEAPSQSGRPISQWTGREIAEEIIPRGIVATISTRHAARLLKGGFSHTDPDPLLADLAAGGALRRQGRRPLAPSTAPRPRWPRRASGC